MRNELRDIQVPIPFGKAKIVIRNGKTVEMEVKRTYSKETKDSRVVRRTIGKVVPMFPEMMYPNENYFILDPDGVPSEIRDAFLMRCERQREIARMKKNPGEMVRRAAEGIRKLKEAGREQTMEEHEATMAEQEILNGNPDGMKTGGDMNEKNGNPDGMKTGGDMSRKDEEQAGAKAGGKKTWYISSMHDLEYTLKVFNDLYMLMETYAEKRPDCVIEGYKVKMFNEMLEELKLSMPSHQILQALGLIEKPRKQKGEDGVVRLYGMTYSDALMLLTWYKNAIERG